jgi:hypothetical protein
MSRLVLKAEGGVHQRESEALDEESRVVIRTGEGGVRCGSAIARTPHAAVVERIQPLAERRCHHLVLASIEQQVEHEGTVQFAFGHEREQGDRQCSVI